jgi:citrate lyase subunit beta/citryl-CoA lyase
MWKAPRSGADVLVFDLEDAVGPGEKDSAPESVRSVLRDTDFTPDAEVCVRINPEGIAADDDLAAVLGPDLPDAVMVPKTAGPEDIETIDRLMREHGQPRPVFSLIESAAGVLNAPAIAAADRVAALVFGAEDLAADVGASPSEDLHELSHARQRVVMAAAAAGVDAIDTVFTAIEDTDGLRAATQAAARLGYDGKLAIHPDQVEPIHDGFRPDEDDLQWAERVLDAASGHEGVFNLDGQMIDAPLIERAKQIVVRAGQESSSE